MPFIYVRELKHKSYPCPSCKACGEYTEIYISINISFTDTKRGQIEKNFKLCKGCHSMILLCGGIWKPGTRHFLKNQVAKDAYSTIQKFIGRI